MCRDTVDLQQLLRRLTTASKVMQLYSIDHPQVRNALSPIVSELNAFIKRGASLILSAKEDGIWYGTEHLIPELSDDGPLGNNLLQLGISEIVLKPGLLLDEFIELIELLSINVSQVINQGGIQSLYKKKKWEHIRLVVQDFSRSEGEALIQSYESMTEEEKTSVKKPALEWFIEQKGELPEEHLARLAAMHKKAGGFGELLEMLGAPDSALDDSSVLRTLSQFWLGLARASLNIPSVEYTLAKDLLTFGPDQLLDFFQQEGHARRYGLCNPFRSMGYSQAGAFIAKQLSLKPGLVSDWIELGRLVLKQTGDRRKLFLSAAENLQTWDGKSPALPVLENEIADSGKLERGLMQLFQSSAKVISKLPYPWQGRWESAILTRRCIGLLERLQIPEDVRIQWISLELERLIKKRDHSGIIELLESTRDRVQLSETRRSMGVISANSMKLLPELMHELSVHSRTRFITAIREIDERWRELIASLLEFAEGKRIHELAKEFKEAGYDVHEIISTLLQHEQLDDLKRAIRLLGILGSETDAQLLLPLLQHEDHKIRIETLEVLVNLSPDDLVLQIPTLILDSNPIVARAALTIAPDLPGITEVVCAATQDGWLRNVPEELGLEVVMFMSELGSLEEQAEFATAALSTPFTGRSVPVAVKDAVKIMLGKKERKPFLGFFRKKNTLTEKDADV